MEPTTRWDLLFADLEGQAAAAKRAVQAGEVAELTRAEQAAMPLADRLRAVIGAVIAVELTCGEAVRGQLKRVAASWLLLDGNGPRGRAEHLIPLAAIATISPLSRRAVPSARAVDTLGLGSVLRGLQRDRSRVVLRTKAGQLAGRLARVGHDHVDVEDIDRTRAITKTVPFTALLSVSQA